MQLRWTAEANSERFSDDQPRFGQVRGRLIIGSCIFQRHWVVANEAGQLREITPSADPLPFAPHYPRIGRFDDMPAEIFLLDGG